MNEALGQPETARHHQRGVQPRPRVVWMAVLVFIAGNAADLMNWVPWGPNRASGWVHASAAAFWLAAAVLVVATVDLYRLVHSRADDSAGGQLRRSDGPISRRTPAIRAWVRHNHALLGAVGLIVGGVVGHFIWKP